MSSQDFEGSGGGAGATGGGFGDEVAGYAAEVRAQFADLPADESADLLEDLEDHLREVAAEGTGTLRQRLGAPAAYARELRQAAGLPEPGEGNGSGASQGPKAGAPSWWRVLRTSVRGVVADAERRIRVNPAGAAVLDFLPSLRPAWWVVRAWVVVRALQVMTTYVNTWHDFSLIPRVGDSTLIGTLLLLVAIPASVYLGRRNYSGGWPRRLMVAGQYALVVFTAGMVFSALQSENDDANVPSGSTAYVQVPQQGLSENGNQVSNLYVYDQNGKLLNGVLIYDQDGQPVRVGPFYNEETDTDGWLDGNGAMVPNAFPRQLLAPQWAPTARSMQMASVPPPTVSVPQGLHPATDEHGTSSPTPGAVGGAQTTSALPTTPNPPGATH